MADPHTNTLSPCLTFSRRKIEAPDLATKLYIAEERSPSHLQAPVVVYTVRLEIRHLSADMINMWEKKHQLLTRSHTCHIPFRRLVTFADDVTHRF